MFHFSSDKIFFGEMVYCEVRSCTKMRKTVLEIEAKAEFRMEDQVALIVDSPASMRGPVNRGYLKRTPPLSTGGGVFFFSKRGHAVVIYLFGSERSKAVSVARRPLSE